MARFTIALVLLAGCFEHHAVDGTVRIDGGEDAARRDAGFCLCASDLDCPEREGCVEYVCEACECRPKMVPRCGECMCVSDADCPTPPPFGDCVRTVCTDCICSFIADDAACGPDGRCDPDTFLCTSASNVEIEIFLRTDYEPVVEFDRITVYGGMDSLDYLPAPTDPFLTMGLTLGTLRVPPGELTITSELWSGDVLVTSREELAFAEEGGVAALTVAR